jgi:hypothetical protein
VLYCQETGALIPSQERSEADTVKQKHLPHPAEPAIRFAILHSGIAQ